MPQQLGQFGGFKPTASGPQNGLAIVYDLEGFSVFFNQPDAHEYIPRYLSSIIDAVERCLFGGDAFWLPKGDKLLSPLPILPVYRKFLGDGMLYVWSLLDATDSTIAALLTTLTNRLWNIKKRFAAVNRSCAEVVPLAELPPRIRVGVGRGTIYALTAESTFETEYIGICINLASRLQGYCPYLGFIASARIGMKDATLEQHGYIKVVATRIKGFPREIVIVDRKEFEQLPKEVKRERFEPF